MMPLEVPSTPPVSIDKYRRRVDFVESFLEVAAGLEIGTVGALELASFLMKLGPAVRAGTFDLFQVGRVTCAGRHAVCRPVVLCRNILRDGRGWLPHPQGGLRTS